MPGYEEYYYAQKHVYIYLYVQNKQIERTAEKKGHIYLHIPGGGRNYLQIPYKAILAQYKNVFCVFFVNIYYLSLQFYKLTKISRFYKNMSTKEQQ